MRTKDPFFRHLHQLQQKFENNRDLPTWQHFQLACQWSISTWIHVDLVSPNTPRERMNKMANNITWCNLRLNKSDRAELANFAEVYEDDLEGVMDILQEDGIKISASYNTNKQAWCITFIGTENSKHNFGFGMSTWSNVFTEALWMSAFKHIHLCNRAAWNKVSSDDTWG